MGGHREPKRKRREWRKGARPWRRRLNPVPSLFFIVRAFYRDNHSSWVNRHEFPPAKIFTSPLVLPKKSCLGTPTILRQISRKRAVPHTRASYTDRAEPTRRQAADVYRLVQNSSLLRRRNAAGGDRMVASREREGPTRRNDSTKPELRLLARLKPSFRRRTLRHRCR